MSAENPVHLVFDPSLKVAGQVLEGSVELYWPEAVDRNIEEVIIKLRGELSTSLERRATNFGNNHHHSRYKMESEYVDVIKQDIVLWNARSRTTPPHSEILRFPFRLQLPENLPPSCDVGSYDPRGKVGYYLEAVGKRSGMHFSKKDLIPFPVLPPSSLGAQLKSTLDQGWRGPWKTVELEKEMRRGLWGEYAHAKVTIALPEVEVLPMFTSIPVSINIVTMSKHMHLDETPTDEPVFPAPPTKSGEIELNLRRKLSVKAHGYDESSTDDHVQVLGGLGADLPLDQYKNVQVRPSENMWIPSEGDKGQWKQQATVTTSFRLSAPPTFETANMSISYSLHLKVDFPGIGNDVKIDVPVRIESSIYNASAQAGWANMPVPHMDLPQSYFEAGTWQRDTQ